MIRGQMDMRMEPQKCSTMGRGDRVSRVDMDFLRKI
jgi:hypothetical protein